MTLLYVHGESIGYGRLGVKLAEALEAGGVDVYDDLGDVDAISQPINKANFSMPEGRKRKQTNVVGWVAVPTHARGWYTGQVPVMFTMWEATKLPEGFRDTMGEFDTIIVPSLQNVELFSRYHDNVKFVPLGVDPTEWSYVERKAPGAYFDFLLAGSGKRKGVDLAVKAFRKLYGKSWPKGGPVPRLVLKNPRNEDFTGERIEMVAGRIDPADEQALYASAHCYLQPSRGEGFGLQPLQAIATGLPTILTDAHGHESFSHLGYGLDTTHSPADYFIYGDAGEWWEPDFDQLCELMEYVYNNYDAALAHGKRGAETVAAEWTWAHAAEKFVDAIGRERLETPYSGSGDWYATEGRKFPVILNRDWACDIGGTSYAFTKGVLYHELADVKRIMFEADLLDPACLSDDHNGLTEEQMTRVGAYSAKHAYCHTCLQKLGTGEMRP